MGGIGGMEIVILGMFGSTLLVVALVVVFVVLRNSSRRKSQGAAWQSFAQKYGGQFAGGQGAFSGNRILFAQPHTRILVETTMVSVMQAAGSPYFPDGGTFTVIKGAHPTSGGPMIRCDSREAAAAMPPQAAQACAMLPPGTIVFSSPAEAVVVLRGAVEQEQPLWAALTVVSALTAANAAAGAQNPMAGRFGHAVQ